MEGVVLLLGLLLTTVSAQQSNLLETMYEWKQMDYDFPNKAMRKNFVPENVVPFDVDVSQSKTGGVGKVFVTVPKFRPGIPASLNTVVTNNKGEPLLKPYPDWSWHREGNCDGITSVFRVQVDQCGRLWVLDSGMTNIFGGAKRSCQPQLLVFNIKNDKLLMRYRFPDSVLKGTSVLVTAAVDVLDPNGRCQDSYAYVADLKGFAVIVVDMHRSRSWRVNSNLFYPDPLNGHFNLNGVQFDLMDGVLGLALSPSYNSLQDKTLYFHSLTTVREAWVSTNLLRNSSHFKGGINKIADRFHMSKGERSGQVGPQATDSKGTLFFSILPSNSFNCWNPSRPYESSNLVELVRDPLRLQYVSGLKVVRDQKNKEWVWMLSNRFQNIIVNAVPKNEVNYRIMRVPVKEMIRGTSCVRRGSDSPQTPSNRPSYSASAF